MDSCPKIEEEIIGQHGSWERSSQRTLEKTSDSYLFSIKPWYIRWWQKATEIFTTDEENQKRICKDAGIIYKTSTERFFEEILKDIKRCYKNVKHVIIFYVLYVLLRLNMISEHSFNMYCFYRK